MSEELPGHPPKEEEAGLPLFYKGATVLDSKVHAKMGLPEQVDFSFAKATNSVPLNGMEFRVATTDYPIVFSANAPHVPVAILGLQEDANLYVNKAGQWRPNTYMPAYVRRYPFIFIAHPDGKRVTMGVDESAGILVEGGRPLYEEDGKFTDLGNQVIEFCKLYHGDHEATLAFAKGLEEQGLLVEKSAEVKRPDGTKMTLGGFKTIDDQKLAKLPDEIVLEWTKKNWMPLIYWVLSSQNNWHRLANLPDFD